MRDGRLQQRNLRREFMTEEELLAQMRENVVEDLSQVKRAYMESDGNIRVIRNDD